MFSKIVFMISTLLIFSDIRELARAAVSGDERALDLMSWTKNNSGIKLTGYSYIEVSNYFGGLADGK